jgi:hypothetical protein
MRYVIVGNRFNQKQKKNFLKYNNLYTYELRYCEGNTTIEKNVLCNHIGSILTEEKLKFDKSGVIDFEDFEKNNELYAKWDIF